jgi:phage shock protein PspC (stress-responsive transcriptional regulator)
MKDSTVSRWMGPLGLLAAVIIFIGLGPLGGNVPGENSSGLSVAHYLNSHVAQEWASVYVVGVGLALLTAFLVHLRTVLRAGGDNILPNLVFAASMFFIIGFAVLGTLEVVMILAAHNHQYAIVQTMNFATNNSELLVVFGMALLTLATGLAILLNRTRVTLPKTLGWYSLVVFVASIAGPVGGLALLFGLPIWIVAIGFVISTKARRNTLEGPIDGGGKSVAAPAGAVVAA